MVPEDLREAFQNPDILSSFLNKIEGDSCFSFKMFFQRISDFSNIAFSGLHATFDGTKLLLSAVNLQALKRANLLSDMFFKVSRIPP